MSPDKDAPLPPPAESPAAPFRDDFRHMADILCLPMAVIAPDGRYEYVNPKFTELLGYTLEDVPTGRQWFRLAFPVESSRREAVAAWGAEIGHGKARDSGHQVFDVACKDGATRQVLFRTSPMSGGRRVVIYEDVTDRRRAEVAEIEHRARLEAVSVLLAGFSSIQDVDDLCRTAVERAPKFLGVDRMALWFRTKDPNVAAGSFGTDENGALRDERSSAVRVSASSLMGRILYQREPVLLQHDIPLRNDRGTEVGRGDAALVAVTADRDVIGCLCVDNLRTKRRIDERQCDLLRVFGAAFGQFYRRAKAEAALRENDERMRAMFETTGDGVVLYRAVDDGADFVIIAFNRAAERIEGVSREALIGRRVTDVFPGIREMGLLDVLQRVWRTGEAEHVGPALYRDTRHEGWRENQIFRLKSGEIVVIYADITERKRDEVRLAASLNQLRTAFDQVTRALASTVAVRDPYTAGHQERVTRLASAIGEEMALSADALGGLRIAGVLHDIGKLQVPAEILSKPTRLTQYEYLLVQSHVEASRDILQKIAFPWPVAEIVYQHHERMNGKGYPRGLAGDAIRIEARVLAVADVVEAMVSHRPYRAALGMDKAVEEIKSRRGEFYDPLVVDACLRVVGREGFTLE